MVLLGCSNAGAPVSASRQARALFARNSHGLSPGSCAHSACKITRYSHSGVYRSSWKDCCCYVFLARHPQKTSGVEVDSMGMFPLVSFAFAIAAAHKFSWKAPVPFHVFFWTIAKPGFLVPARQSPDNQVIFFLCSLLNQDRK